MGRKKKSSKCNAPEQKIKDYEKFLTSLRTIKTSLKSIVRSKETIIKINEIACNTNKIVFHTYEFLSLYIIHYVNLYDSIPDLQEQFIILVMKNFGYCDERGGKLGEHAKSIKNKIEAFYNSYYGGLMSDTTKICYTNIANVLKYEATKILTAYKNHIQEYFEQALNTYINMKFNKYPQWKNMNKQQKYEFRQSLRPIKYDIFHNKSTSNHPFVDHFRKFYLKGIEIEESMAYMCKSNPMQLLLVMIRMSQDGELHELRKLPADQKDKLFPIINCFPRRSSIIPKYVEIDTLTIIRYLIKGNKDYYGTDSNLLKYNHEIWDMFFFRDKKVFNKKGYKFNRMISTDGVGCSILFVRKDLYEPKKKTYVPPVDKPDGYKADIYVDEMTEEQKRACIDKISVGCDPGQNDIGHFTNGTVKLVEHEDTGKLYRQAEHMAFSSKLRHEILKTDHYRDIIEEDKKNTFINVRTTRIDTILNSPIVQIEDTYKSLSVKEIELQLSKVNSHSCFMDNASKFIKLKNEVNNLLQEYYEKEIHRLLKWYSFINKQKADTELIKRFERKFGGPDKVVILIGDWMQKRHRKGRAPSKGISLRKVFKRYGYVIYLVDEYNTSCKLYQTGEDLINIRGCHTLLGSKSLKTSLGMAKCDKKSTDGEDIIEESEDDVNDNIDEENQDNSQRVTIINRDLNGALNIRLKGWSIINDQQVPDYMT